MSEPAEALLTVYVVIGAGIAIWELLGAAPDAPDPPAFAIRFMALGFIVFWPVLILSKLAARYLGDGESTAANAPADGHARDRGRQSQQRRARMRKAKRRR